MLRSRRHLPRQHRQAGGDLDTAAIDNVDDDQDGQPKRSISRFARWLWVAAKVLRVKTGPKQVCRAMAVLLTNQVIRARQNEGVRLAGPRRSRRWPRRQAWVLRRIALPEFRVWQRERTQSTPNTQRVSMVAREDGGLIVNQGQELQAVEFVDADILRGRNRQRREPRAGGWLVAPPTQGARLVRTLSQCAVPRWATRHCDRRHLRSGAHSMARASELLPGLAGPATTPTL